MAAMSLMESRSTGHAEYQIFKIDLIHNWDLFNMHSKCEEIMKQRISEDVFIFYFLEFNERRCLFIMVFINQISQWF